MQISREKLTETLRKTHLFWDLDEKRLNGLISNCQPLFFEAEKLIYLEKSPAGKIYIPFEGSIEILKEKENKLEKINTAFPGVVFGEDALKQQSIRQTSARALEDSIILAIDGEVVAEIAANNPPLRKSTGRYLNSYQLMITKSLAQGDGEVILFASQPHPFRVIGKMLLGIATAVGAGLLGLQMFTALNLALGNQIWFSLILVVMTIGWLIWQYVDWENDIFYFTDKRVVNFQQRLFSSETTQETHLASIEAVQEKKSYLGRMVNYGDLIIKTFTGSMELPLVYDTNWVKDLLTFSISFAVEKMDTVDRQVFAREIQNRIGKDLRHISKRTAIIDRKKSANDKIGISGLKDKETDAEEIVIRTHWTVLFSKTFIPAFLLISHILIYLFIQLNAIVLANRSLFNSIIMLNLTLLSVWFVFRVIDWRNDKYIISENLLVDVNKRPFGTEDSRTASIQNIQSIRYKRNGIFGLLFNFGTVFIRIGDDEFTFDNVFRPANVQEKIFQVKENARVKIEQLQRSKIRENALDWIEAYHNLANNDPNAPVQPEDQEG